MGRQPIIESGFYMLRRRKEKEEDEDKPRRLGVFDRLCMISLFIASAYIIYQNVFTVIDNLTGVMVRYEFIISSFLVAVGVLGAIGAIKFSRHSLILEHIADDMFERVIYTRLEPVLREVAETQVEVMEVADKVDHMQANLNQLERSVERGSVAPTAAPAMVGGGVVADRISFLVRFVLLIVVSLGAFVFLVQYPRFYTPYILTFLFVLWWLAITAEFDLWRVNTAYAIGFAPVLLVPVSSIIIDLTLGIDMLFGIMFIVLVAYAYGYYSWCAYTVKGVLPFDLHVRLRELENGGSIGLDTGSRRLRILRLILYRIYEYLRE